MKSQRERERELLLNKFEAEANRRVKNRRKKAKQAERARKQQQFEEAKTYEGGFRAGRIALWSVFLPLGLWRSVRHGKKRHEQRLAKEIARELRK